MTGLRSPVIPSTEARCAAPVPSRCAILSRGRILEGLLRAARRAIWRRAALEAGVAGLLAAVALALAAAIGAGLSLRGDLAAQALGAAIGATGLALAIQAARAAHRRARTLRDVALEIAQGVSPLAAGLDAGDRRLRHEIIGALDLREGRGRVGSPRLRDRYVEEVEARIEQRGVGPARAVRPMRWRGLVFAAVVLMAAAAGLGRTDAFMTGWPLLWARADGRPPPPPEPVWSSLTLGLTYPEHTSRPPRTIPNPSGALRVPAGTRVDIQLLPRVSAREGTVVVAADPTELSNAPPVERVEIEPDADGSWRASFMARGAGSWTVVLVDDGAEHRSAALPVEIEPDRAPELEVSPPPAGEHVVGDDARVTVRWHARDDFGLAGVELVYQLPDGSTHRLPRQQPAGAPRSWRDHTDWDIASIPIDARSEVLYWLEAIDNDPGLGLDPLPDPPGKRTRSATLRLSVEDEQAEHAENIASLRELRDAAVDVLAERMLSTAFSDTAAATTATRAGMARALHLHVEELLARMAATVDALSLDALTQDGDAEALAGIHRRLLTEHKAEGKLQAELAPGTEFAEPAMAAAVLLRMRPVDARIQTAFEDEIIRLDDLVDGMLIEQLEALAARLEATQRKLVELLEALKAGDESVRPQIEQLEQRRREDLRKLSEIRAQLREEMGEEFMNVDAFEILERMAADEELQAMLQRGEIDRALERARGELDEVSRMRDDVQQQAGEGGAANPLSEAERQRIALLRELGRLQDEEGSLRASTSELQRQWREQVAGREAGADRAQAAGEKAKALREQLEAINDARLGRDARRGLDDARAALDRLEQLAEREDAKALDLAEAADAAQDGIERALSGAERREAEGKALERAQARAEALRERLGGALPSPGEVLPETSRQQFDELEQRQNGLRKRASELLSGPLGDLLPPAGRAGMRRADGGMNRSERALDRTVPRDAIGGQSQAWQGIQEAIDSLRQGSPPPPAGASGDASTEADRDRSLRDELMDAMREDAPPGFVDPVRRYYEELLR